MDLTKTLQKIIENKSIFLAIVVVLAFFVAGVVLWGVFSSKRVSYQNLLQQKKEKNSVIEEYDKVEKQLNFYVDSLSKPLTSDALINKIATYASQNNIDILDITPQGTKKFDYYITTTINLNFKAADFKSLITFIQTLEASPYAFKIQSWKSSKGSERTQDLMTYELNITSVQVKK